MNKSIIGSQYRLGILGGGQLGRMIIQEAINYNIDIHIMDKDENSPCASIAKSYTNGDIKNFDDVVKFGKNLNTLTVEIENVNIDALYYLEKNGVQIFPQPRVLEIIKDKGLQKQFYKENKIPTSEFELISSNTKKTILEERIPFVQKLRTGGYDGRGVELIKSKSDLQNVFLKPSIIEKIVPFVKELSVIVARNKAGQTAVYPIVECQFNKVNLVEFLFSPAQISKEIEEKATKIAVDIINTLDMVGILAVELFLCENGEILVNEIAPRPHNSGHHTIECNITSQFEQHLRSILNMPLGATEMIQCGVMINLLGSEGFNGKAIYEGLFDVTAIDGVHVHIYGKKLTKPHRKMGHITVADKSLDKAIEKAKDIKQKLRVISN